MSALRFGGLQHNPSGQTAISAPCGTYNAPERSQRSYRCIVLRVSAFGARDGAFGRGCDKLIQKRHRRLKDRKVEQMAEV